MDEDAAGPNVVPLRPRSRARPCPICGEPVQPAFKPFCSKHCANKDLLNWLRGDYRHETNEQPIDIDDESDV